MGATTICVVHDPLGGGAGLWAPADGNTAAPDLIVANFGQHLADGSHRWPNKKYRDLIDTFIESLLAGGAGNPSRDRDEKLARLRRRFLWMETNAMSFRKDSFAQGTNDWRTNTRISIMNEYANAKMRKLGVGIIPTFAQTIAMTQTQPDPAHVNHKVLENSVVQHIFQFLCGQEKLPN